MSKKKKKNKGQGTKSSKSPQPLEISMEETEELLKKIEEKKLEDKDFERIKAFIKSFVFIRKLLERQKLSMNKLKNLFFGKGKTEKSKNIFAETAQIPETEPQSDQSREKENKEEIEIEKESSNNDNDNDNDNENDNKVSKKRKGHGRNGASAYVGAEEIYIPHEKLKAGQSCPDCEEANLYKWNNDGIEIRIKGSAPLEAKVYKLEKLRCALCGKLYTAQLPPEAGKDKYDAQAGSMISLLKYGSGFPFYRLDNFQKALGVPVPASTQWEIVSSVFKTVIHPYEEMVRQAAQGELFYTLV